MTAQPRPAPPRHLSFQDFVNPLSFPSLFLPLLLLITAFRRPPHFLRLFLEPSPPLPLVPFGCFLNLHALARVVFVSFSFPHPTHFLLIFFFFAVYVVLWSMMKNKEEPMMSMMKNKEEPSLRTVDLVVVTLQSTALYLRVPLVACRAVPCRGRAVSCAVSSRAVPRGTGRAGLLYSRFYSASMNCD